MKKIETTLPGVVLVEPTVFGDERGFFMESFNRKSFEQLGLPGDYVQDNHSRSSRDVLRGIHYQVNRPQGKLVRAIKGSIFDIAVDLRSDSDTFGKWAGFELSEENKRMAWIPPEFGHAFLVLSEVAEVVYKTTDYYSPQDERSIIWNDPQIGIEWPLSGEPVLSGKDADAPLLQDADTY